MEDDEDAANSPAPRSLDASSRHSRVERSSPSRLLGRVLGNSKKTRRVRYVGTILLGVGLALSAWFIISERPPKGFLGFVWGDDAKMAQAKLQLQCERWEPWEGKRGYESCFDIDHLVDAFGHKAYPRLFRSENKLEGLSLRFMQCGAVRNALRNAICKEFATSASNGSPYKIFRDGTAVRFDDIDRGDDSCVLTIAGPAFGPAFGEYQLEDGFKSLSHGLSPR